MQILFKKKCPFVNFLRESAVEFDFNPTVNTVLGDNATGKTTIMNAFCGAYLERILKTGKTSR